MASQLGELVNTVRKAQGLGLRALAREIDRSPSFLVMIEKSDSPPGISEETLRRIAAALDLNPDQLLTLAGKTPDDVVPADEVEVAIYRHVKRLSREQQEELLRHLQNLAP